MKKMKKKDLMIYCGDEDADEPDEDDVELFELLPDDEPVEDERDPERKE
jgi:hypothetical protein